MHNHVIRVLCTALVLSLVACGGGGGGSTANTAPVITEGTSTSISMSVNATPNAFSLSLHATDADNDTLTWSIGTIATHGTASASGTGTSMVVGYTPTTDYAGADSFVVKVSDGKGGTDSITVNVTVNNDATPVIAEGASTNVGMSVNGMPNAFSLTLNALDANGETLTWSISTQASNGTASASGTGTSKTVGYIPTKDYAGMDSFVVKVSDGNGGTDTITVNVTVNNDAPPVIAEGSSTSVIMSVNSTPTAFSLTLNASDANNETLTWSSSAAAHGTASASGTGTSKSISYTPTADYIGPDSFDVTVSDGNGGTDTIIVNVTVTNDNPVITQGASTSVSLSENSTPTAFSLTLDASDINGDPLTWSLGSTAAQHGTPTVSGTGATPVVGYTPNTDYVGTDSFDVQVSDNHGGTATITVNVTVTNNSIVISVDAGPASTPAYNKPYVSVTICDTNTTPTCQTIDHILLDTGSVGLRILSTAFSTLPYANLTPYTGTGSNTIGECYQLAGGILWGTLRTATVQMAGETTTAIPIQVVNDNTVAAAPSACTNLGADLGSVSSLKANGILGVGYFKRDCGSTCETASNTVYYTCPTTCSSVGVLAADQVSNPVTQFGVNWNGFSDNNGVIVSLPAISSAGAANVSGTLTFGVNTQANNQLGSALVLPVDKPTGLLYTYFDNQYLCNSAIDTGSNNLNFPQGTTGLPLCTSAGNTNFYCPASLTPFSATIYGVDGAYAMTNFNVANTDGLSSSYTAFNDIAANLASFITTTKSWCPSGGTNGSFIWGLPFFFGKDVFVVFDGNTIDSSMRPFIAF